MPGKKKEVRMWKGHEARLAQARALVSDAEADIEAGRVSTYAKPGELFQDVAESGSR